MGLFTGMSILSFCEIIFWLLRIFLPQAEIRSSPKGNTPVGTTTGQKPARRKTSRKQYRVKKHNIIGMSKLAEDN